MILVVGGGIGGLSLAVALAKRGVPCELVEREREWTTVGAGIALYPNGLRALRSLGLDRAVEDAGATIHRVQTMARDGTVMNHIDPHVSTREGEGAYGTMGEGVTVDAIGNIYVGEVSISGMTMFMPM